MASIETVAAEIKRKLGGDPSIDLEFLARLFEDTTISDLGRGGNELQNRLGTILESSSDGTNGGTMHFAGIFAGLQDRGFRTAFHDPWRTGPHPSYNQAGHFCTAVDIGYRPMQTYNFALSVFNPVGVPMPQLTVLSFAGSQGAAELLCIQLIVGHEKVANDAWASTWRQAVWATADDVKKFNEALSYVRLAPNYSMEDLHLSVYGYQFGAFIRKGQMTTCAAAAEWIRTDLGARIPDQAPAQTGGILA